MMKAGGATKRKELQRMFAELKITGANTRELTDKEANVAQKGDKD